MRFIVFLVLFMFSLGAFASGKIQVQPNFFSNSGKIRPLIGLSIYEKLTTKFAFNGWYGYGDQAFTDRPDVGWYSLRTAVDYYYDSKWVFSPGVQYVILEEDSSVDERIFIRASYQLW